jgi:hypothetical protein
MDNNQPNVEQSTSGGLSKGQMYKLRTGHSKSMRRAMHNNLVDDGAGGERLPTIEEYRKIRRKKQKASKKARKPRITRDKSSAKGKSSSKNKK